MNAQLLLDREMVGELYVTALAKIEARPAKKEAIIAEVTTLLGKKLREEEPIVDPSPLPEFEAMAPGIGASLNRILRLRREMRLFRAKRELNERRERYTFLLVSLIAFLLALFFVKKLIPIDSAGLIFIALLSFGFALLFSLVSRRT